MATLTKTTGTVTLSGAAEKVTFPAVYGWVWVKNMSNADMFVGLSEGISAGADGVLSIPAGDAGRIQTDGQDSVYLLGSGNALVVAQNYADCPFKSGTKGGGADVGGESSYVLKNAVDYPLLGIKLYGKSVQDGVPTPENPVEIVSVGDGGTVNITSDNGGDITVTAAITSAMPLCGIPVESGGNYTDSNGQQWVCDELVYNADGTGKIIKRTNTLTMDGSEGWRLSERTETRHGLFVIDLEILPSSSKAFCDRYVYKKWICNDIIGTFDTEWGQIRFNANSMTVDEWKTLLASNHLTAVYAITKPQVIELTATEMTALRELQTFNGITNISNDGGADMDITYCTNKTLSEYVMPITTGLQKQIDELKAAVLSLGGNI